MEDRFALLIDADNVSAKYIKPILDELSKYGNVTYKRIYGDWTSSYNSSWKEELLYTSELEGFCLVSSDSDFTKLASRLRESGRMVIGMGESKTPVQFYTGHCTGEEAMELIEEIMQDQLIRLHCGTQFHL